MMPGAPRSLILIASAVLAACVSWMPTASAGALEDWIRSFAESEIVFQRSSSNVPFQPLAFVDARYYGDAEVRRTGEKPVSYDQTTISQAAGLPFLLSPRDVGIVGEWISWSQFDVRNSDFKSFDVLSVGLPVGWLRQAQDRWQVAAFVMPLGHKANLGDAPWAWETLGGVFGRYLQNDRLWWAVGFYFDAGPGDDVYLPYLGAAWEIDDRWTLSAVLPWPAVLYAPNKNTLFRLGAAPSGASWSLRPNGERVTFTLDSWDLGLSAEFRVQGNFWLMVSAGVGGLRALRVVDGRWEEPDVDLGSSPFVGVSLNYRPAL